MPAVRVRFAPSPTGALHIGGVRTALYNYLFARKHKGTMILRIEDTDQGRFVPGAEEHIVETLRWVGIGLDEGVSRGGPHAPYRQSERKEMYKAYAQRLVDEGNAYYAFDTPGDLDALRKSSQTFQYDSATRMGLKNALAMAGDEVTRRLSSGEPFVIRAKIPRDAEVTVNDLIRGEVTVSSAQLDDKVLMKADGMPTYHLANVVDDFLMKITHVIRGEEWLPSAPLHVLLYKFLGWSGQMPQFAHLPLLLKPDGNGKLSKRDADKMGFPIFPLTWKDPFTGETAMGYREAGYLPDALINFLAFLGWNPGTTQEIFSMDELIDAFSLERIGKAGARFDIQKAQWYNQQYLKSKPDTELAGYLLESLRKEGIECHPDKSLKIVQVMKERVTFPADFWTQGKFFFRAPEGYDDQVAGKKWNEEAVRVLKSYAGEIAKLTTLAADEAKTLLEEVSSRSGVKSGQVLQALRVSLTGGASGPDLMMTMEILGPKEVAGRIEAAIKTLKVKVA